MRLSEGEYEQLAEAAAASRLSLAAYLAMVARNDSGGGSSAGAGWTIPQRRAIAAQLYWVRHGLRGAWRNLNRLTRIAQGQDRLPPEVPAAAAAIRDYLPRLEAVMTHLDPQTQRGLQPSRGDDPSDPSGAGGAVR